MRDENVPQRNEYGDWSVPPGYAYFRCHGCGHNAALSGKPAATEP